MIDVTYPQRARRSHAGGDADRARGTGAISGRDPDQRLGAQDRDETLFEHKPFLVLADTLTRKGVAVLRVDDRGVGSSTGSVSNSTSDDFAGDVLAGVAYLRSRGEIDGARIGLIGHSEGGIIAPIAATRDPGIAFIVLMAGTGLPGEEILYLQGQLILKAGGADEKTLKMQHDIQKSLFAILKTDADEKARGEDAGVASRGLRGRSRGPAQGARGPALVEGQLKLVRSPWFRFFLTYDPCLTLGKVRCPVLAVVGEKGPAGASQGEPLGDRVDPRGRRQ